MKVVTICHQRDTTAVGSLESHALRHFLCDCPLATAADLPSADDLTDLLRLMATASRKRSCPTLTEFQIQRLAGAHVWADIQRLAADRDLRVHPIPSHGKSSTAVAAPVDWMLAVYAAADQEAGRQANKRNSGALLQCRRRIVSFLDNRAVQVQQALSARYVVWHDLLKSAQPLPKLGCKPPSRVQLVQHARDLSAHPFCLYRPSVGVG